MNLRSFSFLLPKNPIHLVARHLVSENASILDLGFGSGKHWEPLGQETASRLRITGLDSHSSRVVAPAIEVVNGYIPEALFAIPSDSFDHVIAFDLIEHLSQSNGYLLIYEMERIARVSAWIFTTNGHVWQPPAEGNVHQAHVSGWKPRDFKRLGWRKQFGCRGLKYLYGPLAIPLYSKPEVLMSALRVIPDWIATRFPAASFSFVAGFIKDSKSRRLRGMLEKVRTN